MSDGCGGRGRFTRLSPEAYRNTFARRMIRIQDRAQDLSVRLGFRPYRVWIVRTFWSGGRRGAGVEELTAEFEILPVPRVSGLDGLQEILTPTQMREVGSLLVTEISGSYTEDQLKGLDTDGAPPAPEEQVYWEIQQLTGGAPAERRRFTPRSAPTYQGEPPQWQITLTKVAENRNRDGTVR